MLNLIRLAVRTHWWVLLIRGIFALVFGIVALADPSIVLLAFIYVFALYAILDGITTIISALHERRSVRSWWVLLLEGIVGVIFGIVVLAWPVRTALVLLYLVAIWALVMGVLRISSAFMVPGTRKHRLALGLAGLLSLAFGVILLVHPGAGLLAILWLVGIFAIVLGAALIIYAFQVRTRTLARMPSTAALPNTATPKGA